MKNKHIILAVFLIVMSLFVVMVAIRGFSGEDTWICQDGEWVKHGNPVAPMPTIGCAVNIEPDDNKVSDENKSNIIVSKPVSGAAVTLPFHITGEARVFENVFNYRLTDKNGTVLIEGNSMANSPDVGQFGPYDVNINYLYKLPADSNVTLEVFWNSPKDGAEIDKVVIPLALTVSNTQTLKAFFNNSKLDPEASCNKVFSVERIVAKTPAPARDILLILLQGLSKNEIADGYFTSINQGVKINGIVIDAKGAAKVDFDETLESQVGGSCRVAAIRAQITGTLMQFSTVKSVLISINGRTEDILQP